MARPALFDPLMKVERQAAAAVSIHLRRWASCEPVPALIGSGSAAARALTLD